jgi:hypothetical protein
MVLRSQAILLDFQTRLVEAAKRPLNQRMALIKEIDSSLLAQIPLSERRHSLVYLLYPAVTKIAQIEQRLHANLACAIAGLGAERVRLEKGRWPESLDEIVQAGCLKKVPIDPFDGNPLRFRRTKDGLVVYSIGPEGKNDGKALDDLRNIDESLVRVEFRLWDPKHRRQPPLPRREKK